MQAVVAVRVAGKEQAACADDDEDDLEIMYAL
jgi:hypothetical protein